MGFENHTLNGNLRSASRPGPYGASRVPALARPGVMASALVTLAACSGGGSRRNADEFCRKNPDDSLCGKEGGGGAAGDEVLDPVPGFPDFRVAPLGNAGAPAPRHDMAHAWTGKVLIVAGGRGDAGSLASAASYDPATGAWKGLKDLPEGRAAPAFAWTGSQLIVWGGARAGSHDEEGAPRGGGWRYEPGADSWSALPAQGEPSARLGAAAAWDGRYFVVWGGRDASGADLGDGARFDPAAGAWSPVSRTGAPAARQDHSLTAGAGDAATGAGTGGASFLFGGRAAGAPLGDSFLYDSASDTWKDVSGTGGTAPSGRFGHAAFLAGGAVLVAGGASASGGKDDCPSDGGLFDPSKATWSPIPGGTKAPPGRGGAAGFSMGGLVFLYGGACGGELPIEGGIFAPDSGAWTRKKIAGRASGVARGAAAWTGASLLLWGGLISRGVSTNEGTRVTPGKPERDSGSLLR